MEEKDLKTVIDPKGPITRIFVKEYCDEDIVERTDSEFAEIGYKRVGYSEIPADKNDPLSGTMIYLKYSR